MVSIPFKRESVSELSSLCDNYDYFLSVSIPFKRESVSEHDGDGNGIPGVKGFNSLQTGKRI